MNKYNDTGSFPVNEKVDINNNILNHIINKEHILDNSDYKGLNTIKSQKLYNNLDKNHVKINLTKKKKRIEK